MGRFQWIAITSAAALFLLIYFGLDTRPPVEANGTGPQFKANQATSADVLIQEALPTLNEAQVLELELMEKSLVEEETEAGQIEILKSISSTWYQYGNAPIAGHFALLVAEKEQTPEAWGIAGSTFSIGLQRSAPGKVREFCAQQAITCFEKAISLDPEEVAYRLNLALVYTERPLENDPMRGVLMLRDLNQSYPDNVPVMNNLARLALQTGQTERALQRLERAFEIDSENPVTICLLAQAYQIDGQQDKAGLFSKMCEDQRN